MLYIRTGKPGHGKTLNTIREVDAKAKAEGRVVYFHNVAGLKPDKLDAPWFEFDDPLKWYELPHDAIIVVDESQGWFGVRDPRNRPPEHITRFETMRHQGHEVHLVTQDPRYIDVHLRRLCNGHIHYWRVFKSQQLLRFESEVVIENVEKKTSFKDADKTVLKLDKKYFGVYTSTQAKHHFKFNPPKKAIMAAAVIVGAIFMVYRAYERYQQGIKPAATAQASGEKGVVDQAKSVVGSLISPGGGADTAKATTPEQYIAERKPRIADVPASAPVYDQLNTPVSRPRIYCLSTSDPRLVERRPPETVRDGTSCQCYTQQSSKFATSFDFCLSVARNGYFDPAIPDRSTGPEARMAQQQSPAQPTSAPGQQQASNGEISGPRVTIIPHQKGEFLW